MRIERIHIVSFIVVAGFLWWCTLFFQGTPVTWEHSRPFTVVVGCLVLLWIIFDRWFWRWRWFHGWFVKRPDLRGTWHIELRSNFIKPETGEITPAQTCFMGIEQTLSELKVHLMTPESESWSIASHILPSPSGRGYQVICVYRNKPNIHLRDQNISAIHYGTLIIDTHGAEARPDNFTAEYWTDRDTKGSIRSIGRVGRIYTCYEDANQHHW